MRKSARLRSEPVDDAFREQHKQDTLNNGGSVWSAMGWLHFHVQASPEEGLLPEVDIFKISHISSTGATLTKRKVEHFSGLAMAGLVEGRGRSAHIVRALVPKTGARAVLQTEAGGFVETGKLHLEAEAQVAPELGDQQEANIPQANETPIRIGGVAVSHG